MEYDYPDLEPNTNPIPKHPSKRWAETWMVFGSEKLDDNLVTNMGSET